MDYMRLLSLLVVFLFVGVARAQMPSAASLIESNPQAAGKLTKTPGTVTWKVFSRNNSGAFGSDVIVGAMVVIPERDIRLAINFLQGSPPQNRKNTFISHFVEVGVTPSEFLSVGGIKEIPRLWAQSSETEFGAAPMSNAKRFGESIFLIGLIERPERGGYNLQLLNENDWFELAIQYGDKDKTRAFVTFQKGPSGAEAFKLAFAAWGVTPKENPTARSTQVQRIQRENKTPKFEILQSVRNQVMACWPTPTIDNYPEVSIEAHYNIDGTLYGEPEPVLLKNSTATPEATATALAAVKSCQPVRMHKENFEYWRTTEIVFGGR
jgi:hypothetical protein